MNWCILFQIPTDGLIISIVGMDLAHWKLTKI